MILAEEFGHQVVDLQFEELIAVVVTENAVTILRCPADVADLGGDQGDCVGGEDVDLADFGEVREHSPL